MNDARIDKAIIYLVSNTTISPFSLLTELVRYFSTEDTAQIKRRIRVLLDSKVIVLDRDLKLTPGGVPK